jgi:stage V sporulation protein R
MDRFGTEEVENFIDCCLSIEDLIDIHSTGIRRREDVNKYDFDSPSDADEPVVAGRLRAKPYMDAFINPPELLATEARQIKEKRQEGERRFPPQSERDVMQFLIEHAPLSPWQADVLTMLRDEAYYFAPQAQTKIMNEGWASYWHSTIMTRQGLTAGEVINYCDHHASTMASSPQRLNPYKLGIELFREIEERWNKGRFGKDYDECDDLEAKRRWDTEAGLGREKVFEVRRVHNDLTFIDTFLTYDFCRQHKLFQFGYHADSKQYRIESREFDRIKQQLLFNLTNLGQPLIRVEDGNHANRGELLLKHEFAGVELQLNYAKDTLVNLHRLWNRPVHIETVLDNTVTVVSFDGSEHKLDKRQKVPK